MEFSKAVATAAFSWRAPRSQFDRSLDYWAASLFRKIGVHEEIQTNLDKHSLKEIGTRYNLTAEKQKASFLSGFRKNNFPKPKGRGAEHFIHGLFSARV
jgi:hypothetical protein